MKKIILWVFCLFYTFTYAQEFIQGIVLDSNNNPISGANVYWENSKIATVSNIDGTFKISKTENHKFLLVSYVGFKAKKIEIIGIKNYTIVLEPDTELKEIVVEQVKQGTIHSKSKPQNTQTLTEKELLKAACCNLSESFSTNPTIDVNFSDGVSGNRQIKMLGLTSPYILFTEGNIPTFRGVEQNYGISFVPGTWIESIQITKGAGSVVNGYESISGQINYELLKPCVGYPLFINVYGSTENRYEINLQQNQEYSDKLGSSLFVHGNTRPMMMDQNSDGFLDNPMGKQVNILNRWKYEDLETGTISFLNIKYITDQKQMGQTIFDHKKDKGTTKTWGSEIDTEKIEITSKIGKTFPDMPYQSIGFQNSYHYQKQESYFGLNHYDNYQKSFYSNLIFSSIINNTKHKFSTGINFVYDKIGEHLKLNFTENRLRNDNSVGAFFEYTYDNLENFSLISGIRIDNHNRLKTFVTPRLHIRYNPWESTVIRASVGRGKRQSNIFAENQNLFASSRDFFIVEGLNSEIAWNYGLNFIQTLKVFNFETEFVIDFYRTAFQNQVIADLDNSPQKVLFYNLDGESFANTFQAEFNILFTKHFSLRTAYKLYNVKTTYEHQLLEKPLQPKHRIFANIAYETHITQEKQWKFDATYNWTGQQRLPNTTTNPSGYQLQKYSAAFSTINAQITRTFSKNFEVYMGGENIGNYRQKNAIIASDNPFSDYFDSSLIYGPIFGQMYYAGIRLKIR